MTYPGLDYRLGAAAEERATNYQDAVAKQNAQMAAAQAAQNHPQTAYMRQVYAQQAVEAQNMAAQRTWFAEQPDGDIIDGEYTVVDVPLLGPPDSQADE